MSNMRPYFKDDSISSLMTNLITFNKLDLSIATGSLSETEKKTTFMKQEKKLYQNISGSINKFNTFYLKKYT